MSNEFAPCPLFGDDLVDVGQLPCGVSTVNCGRCGLSVPATDDESTEFRCDALPPLPEPIEVGGEGWDWEDFQAWKTFTADQMQEYGTACVVAAAWAAKGGNGVPEAPAVEALPQLPEPKYCADDLTDIFTADQMQAYARAAVEADRVQRREHCRWPTCESEAKQEEIAAQAYRELYSGEGGADRVQQGEPVAYGATDFGYTLAGVELEEGDKRVLAFIVNSFGSDHPSVLDLTALFFRRAATKAAAPADAVGPGLDADEMTRLRRLMRALDMTDVDQRPDSYVRGVLFAVLGQAAGRIEGAAPVPDTGIPTAGELPGEADCTPSCGYIGAECNYPECKGGRDPVSSTPTSGAVEKAGPACWCHACNKGKPRTRMILCPTCGNKRCPHANDYGNACTGSNDIGQPGSAYPARPSEAKAGEGA